MSQSLWAALLKVVIASLIIVASSEAAKRSSLLGGAIASLPLTSILALSFLYFDTRDSGQVTAMAKSIVLMIVPSFVFFGLLIAGLSWLKVGYWIALPVSCAGMAASYLGYTRLLEKLNWA